MKRSRFPVAALAAASLLSGCQQSKTDRSTPVAAATTSSPKISAPLTATNAAMDREALLLAVIKAASSASLGKIDLDAQRRLDGKQFALRLTFGCDGPAPRTKILPRAWRLDDKHRVQSFRVELDIGGDAIEPLTDGKFEAVEGFWIDRPWILQPACPLPASSEVATEPTGTAAKNTAHNPVTELGARPPGAASARVGIIELFSDTDARTHRRDSRAYTATKTLAANETPSTVGYDLIVSGRLRRLPDGRVIFCQMSSQSRAPDCFISAQFDSVVIERPDNGEVIATWSGA